jgi:hypothetical protein
MMQSEFMSITGLQVSFEYYTDVIEPLYRDGTEVDKSIFCQQWMKENKAQFVKVHAADWCATNRSASGSDRYKVERDNANAACAEAKEQLERTKAMLEQVSRQNDEYYNRKVEAQEKAKEYSKFEPELAAAKETIAAKDAEIQRLKAMLFDAMYGSKAA